MTVKDGDAGSSAGVEAGALSSARARAAEIDARPPLFTDPYVRTLIDAAATGTDTSPLVEPASRQTLDHVAARTKWFDDFFLTAGSAGVSQVVILAPGLDTRAWRLPWLTDTVIYEIDRPAVLGFKHRVLTGADATPAARYVAVSVPAGDEWPAALAEAGFDHTEPTAWAAEGLFTEIPSESVDTVLDKVHLYSARGSRIAVEAAPGLAADIECRLCAQHWEIDTTPSADLLRRYHRSGEPGDDTVYLSGRKL